MSLCVFTRRSEWLPAPSLNLPFWHPQMPFSGVKMAVITMLLTALQLKLEQAGWRTARRGRDPRGHRHICLLLTLHSHNWFCLAVKGTWWPSGWDRQKGPDITDRLVMVVGGDISSKQQFLWKQAHVCSRLWAEDCGGLRGCNGTLG